MKTAFTLDALKNSKISGINPHLFACDTHAKKSKYNNQKVEFDGHQFDSKKEAARYIELRMLQTTGEIKFLNCQVAFQLSVCKYIADFTYLKNEKLIVEDVKSAATRRLSTYRLKKKLMLNELKIEITEV